MTNFKILYVDDEEINLINLRMAFGHEYEILTTLSGQEGLDIFKHTDDIGMVISDQRMPGMTGVEMLAEMYKQNPDPIRVILTAFGQMQTVMDAVNRGHIYQYIIKPWDRLSLKLVIEQARTAYQLKKENTSLTVKLEEKNKILKHVNEKLLSTNKVLQNDLLRREKLEQSLRQSKQRLRKLSVSLMSAQEDERRRLSMELHDGIGQSMAALKLQIRNLENKQLARNTDSGNDCVDQLTVLRQYVNSIIEDLRRLSKDLCPMIIEDLGIDAALQNLASIFLTDNGIECSLETVKIGSVFNVVQQRNLYRIMQEALNNVVRHSEANHVYITLKMNSNKVGIVIRDDGQGFDPVTVFGQVAVDRGIGLAAIEERVKLLDGTIDIHSKPGHGTSLILTLPVNTQNAMH